MESGGQPSPSARAPSAVDLRVNCVRTALQVADTGAPELID